MYLTMNKDDMGVSRCKTMPYIRNCYIMSLGLFVVQVDELLCVISSEAGNQTMS